MSQAAMIQPMMMRAADGPRALACCGPRALALLTAGLAVGYVPHGPSRRGVCCHHGTARRVGLLAAEREAHGYEAVYQALGAMLG